MIDDSMPRFLEYDAPNEDDCPTCGHCGDSFYDVERESPSPCGRG